MNGVIVHTEHIYRAMPVENFVFVVVLLFGAVCFMTMLYLRKLKEKKINTWYLHVLMAAFVTSAVALVLLGVHQMKIIHKEQVVTIDDSVAFNEFFDHYEIISVDGNLYTVKEIEIEDTEPEVPVYD